MSEFTSIQSMSAVWGHYSNLSSVSLLAPSALADDSKIKGSNNDPIQASSLAQIRQNLQQQGQQQQLLQLQIELDSYTQPKKRARLLMDSSDSSSKGLECEKPHLSGGMSSFSPPETELGQNSLLGGLRPSLLKNSLSSNNGVGGNGSGKNNMTQVQQLLQKQQLEELQQLRQLKQREDMLRLSQLQSRISTVELCFNDSSNNISNSSMLCHSKTRTEICGLWCNSKLSKTSRINTKTITSVRKPLRSKMPSLQTSRRRTTITALAATLPTWDHNETASFRRCKRLPNLSRKTTMECYPLPHRWSRLYRVWIR